MDHFPIADFPPLVAAGGVPSPPARNWKSAFAAGESDSSAFHFSHHPNEPDIIPFSGDKLSLGAKDWNLCLVGYSIGRRPFYEALLAAVNKTWNLKGALKMLSLSEGFFLFRFACAEDLETVWTRGVWFLLGKPFILQKWHPKFKPKRENFTTVLIWIKIHDLSLACWNSEGISRIASKVGIPIAADSLTTMKTRLTYARICVLVDCNALYPEEILVSLDGDVVNLKVQYEWRPSPCDFCKSLVHTSTYCPSKPPSTDPPNLGTLAPRGHSRSRFKARKPSSNPGIHNPPSSLPTEPLHDPQSSKNPPSSSTTTTALLTNSIGKPLHYQPHSPPPRILTSFPIQTSPPAVLPVTEKAHSPGLDAAQTNIPNLNSPMKEVSVSISSSSDKLSVSGAGSPDGIISPNRFDILKSQEEVEKPPDPKVKQDSKSKLNKNKDLPPPATGTKKSARGKQKKNSSSLHIS
ncbi:hypothetical protein KFK09_013615 [Dendrobium nobile]|uniref:DUF4283 domain-containing protein n=1 Tax=Dendrobium nobile TaxID=94219 RepID=A0A8T3B7Q8_DENNO|nr:hypothetical protein KFK09_013615 [Dendrobium nobile]